MNTYDFIEFIDKDTEKALAKACQHFALPINRLEWEVVEAGSSGFLGLIGIKKARIKARPAIGSKAEEMATLAAVVNNVQAPIKETESKNKLTLPSTIESTTAVLTKNKKIKENSLNTCISNELVQEESLLVEDACQILNKLIAPLDHEAHVTGKYETNIIKLEIISDETGLLIGRRGQHLEALQYLVTRIINHRKNKQIHITIDTDSYRERRRQALEEMAYKMAEKAKNTNKSISFGPLNAPERRFVHMTLKNHPGITTISRGKGDLKKIIVTSC